MSFSSTAANAGKRPGTRLAEDPGMAGLTHGVLAAALLALTPVFGCGGASSRNATSDSGGSAGSGPAPKSCEVDGNTYRDGEAVASRDGRCSTCVCSDGELDCTAVDCVDGCLHRGTVYQPFEQFPAGDDCNTCHCLENGQVTCTMVECTVCDDIASEYADALEQAKSCDPHEANPCSRVIVEGLVCSCETYVNPRQTEAIARLQALREPYAAGQCSQGTTCGECQPPLGARCSLMEGRCEPTYEASCKVSGVVYASGAGNIPDPVSCNTCQCLDGQLLCTQVACPMACPPDRVYGTQCAQCGPADECEVVEHACLPTCSGSCESGACIEGACRSLCG
jgi:hypothetical protein